MPAPPAKGRLVVASPTLEEANFRRTVVFLLAADEDGALGIVLNRPSDTSVSEVVPQWGSHASEPSVLFVGGPVQPNTAICVGSTSGRTGRAPRGGEQLSGETFEITDSGSDGYSPLIGDLGSVDLNRAPEEMTVSLTGLRVFSGYAGWGPGQLEDEIEAGAWFVVQGRQADVLCTEPGALWEQVLRRQGGWMAVLARHPVDASLN